MSLNKLTTKSSHRIVPKANTLMPSKSNFMLSPSKINVDEAVTNLDAAIINEGNSTPELNPPNLIAHRSFHQLATESTKVLEKTNVVFTYEEDGEGTEVKYEDAQVESERESLIMEEQNISMEDSQYEEHTDKAGYNSRTEENMDNYEIDEDVEVFKIDGHVLHLAKAEKLAQALQGGLSDHGFDDLGSFSSDSYSPFEVEIIPKEVELPKPDIFEVIEKVPDISEVQMDVGSVSQPPPAPTISEKGYFTNPLTGSPATSTPEEEEFSVESFEEEASQEETDFSFEDYDAIHAPLEQQYEIEQHKEEKQVHMIDELVVQKIEVEIEEESSHEEQIDAIKLMAEQVDKFLTEIVDRVVEYVDEEEAANFVRKNLDKTELFAKIVDCDAELFIEMHTRNFLHKKVSEYFRRRHLLRYIIPEKPENVAAEQEKYIEASQKLDQLLGVEQFMIEKLEISIDDLEMEKSKLEMEVEKEVKDFENLIKNTLKRDGMPHLEEFINRDLRKIRELSKDIKEVRLRVISHQHSLAALQVQISNLENIGGGLRLADYEGMQRQTIALSKKVEERNRDLNKLYDRFHNSLHILTHSKLRNELFTKKTVVLINKLKSYINDKNHYRLHVYELKKQRQRIKRLMSDLSLQSGLVDKPILLQDYDETVDRVEKKKKIVEELRQTQKKLEQKLKYLEKDCKTQK